ncbi:MAG: cobalamin biosynthesis protein CobD [Oscillospiraceae bacterium]|nr:cobalamin biosynthesis protein CobD [Oscillospiraceae bacterium]
MRIVFAALCGFLLDLLLGDPAALTPLHPVVLMGHGIHALEGLLRRLLPQTPRGERLGGGILAVLMALGVPGLCLLILSLLRRLWPPLALVLEILWCWQALAVKDLRVEAMAVCLALERGDLAESRRAVGRIVGRDTDALDAPGVARAAVETVAENFSDGVIAPLVYMLLGGAPLALCYKAINTMDSMLGYKNARYLHFGRAAAKLDDAANFLPSRLAALLLIAAARLCRLDAAEAFRIWRRDRRKHESPNSAQCEAAMAGALGLRLCGPASYFGQRKEKPYIGDEKRQIEPADIRRACRMEYAGAILALALLCALRLLLGQLL